MVEQGIYSYSKGIVAPYRRPVSSGIRRKPSFLGRVKAFFKSNEDNGKEEIPKQKRRHTGNVKNGSSPISIPGGFFNSDEPSSFVRLPKRCDNFDISKPTPNTHLEIEEVSSDESVAADSSNAKLADFFSKKGGDPLSEMEMEGVKSLMKKASRSVKSSRRNSVTNSTLDPNNTTDMVYSQVLKRSRLPSINASTMRAPAFIPKYDDSFGSRSLTDTSNGTSSSRRRVFDYSTLPSPYKTTVYKYSAADNSRGGNKGSETSSSSKSMVSKPTGSKKLSNTASALVSLLDNESSSNESSNQLANPYSAHVNQIRKYKERLPAFPPVKQEPSRPTPLKSSALRELENTKGKPTTEVLSKPQQQNPLEKYKPTRSSSLRSNVVKANEEPEKKELEPKPSVPTSSKFSFQFQSRDKDNTSTKSQFQTELKSSDKSYTAPSFSFSKLQPRNFELPDNNSDSDAASVDLHSADVSKVSFPRPVVPLTANYPIFDFGKIPESNVSPDTVDERKVQDFKTLFIF